MFGIKKMLSKTEEWHNFYVTSRHLFTSDIIKRSTLRARHDNLSPFKIHDFRLSSRQADNQLAGKSLSHFQTLGYHGKMCLKYVIRRNIPAHVSSKDSDYLALAVLTQSMEVEDSFNI